MDEITSRGSIPDNECTRVMAGAGELLRRAPSKAPLAPRESFLIAYDRLSTLAEVAPERAFAIVAVDCTARIVDALFVADRTALVIGRHTQCRLRLTAAPISLRHVALLARYEGEQPRVHLWDLNTGHPFATEDGKTGLAVIGEGPMYLSIDEYAIWIVPAAVARAWPSSAKEAWAALPPRHFSDQRVTEDKPLRVRMPSARLAREEITHVTMVQAPLLLGGGEEPEVGWGTLRFAFGTQKQRRNVSAELLERGVLVGRYDRCGLSFDGLSELSRVHLLLVRIGGEVWALDTASTHGVKREGEKISAVVLSDQDALKLAGVLEIDWKREQHATA